MNGELVKSCITADDNRGLVVCHELDEHDDVVVRYNPTTKEQELAIKQMFGEVRIVLAEQVNPETVHP